MLVTVDGIVIGRRNIGEANCFLDILTAEYGVIEVTAHGVKKITSKNLGSASLFSYAKFCLSKNSTRYTLNSSEPKYTFYRISESIEALSLAAYFAEVIRFSSASEQADDRILRFFAITLYELEKPQANLPLIKAVFELRICSMLGFMPDLRACRFCACYEHEKMTFFPDEGYIVCADCAAENEVPDNGIPLTPSLLYTMRYVIYSEPEKVYKFTLNKDTEKLFSPITENYLLSRMNRNFRTLDYYKQLSL